MWRHYLTVGLRSLAANRAYAAVTVGGLALALAGCLMILTYVRYERGYDRWLPGHEHVFQVQTTLRAPGQPVMRSQGSSYAVRDLLKQAFPEIEAVSFAAFGPAPIEIGGEPVFVKTAKVDRSFLDILALPFLHGSAATALIGPNDIVLTKSIAKRRFGTADVLGRTLTIGAGSGRTDYRISGVLRDLPKDSSLAFELLFRFDPAEADKWPAQWKNWDELFRHHYVRLRRAEDAAAINAAMPAWERRVIPTDRTRGIGPNTIDLQLVPLADVHLGAAQDGAQAPGGDRVALATFLVVAALTLALAVINFANLAATHALQRGRELAIRRALGATRADLAQQLLAEAMLVATFAMLLALALVEIGTPWMARMTGAAVSAHYLGDGGLLRPALGLWLATGLAGGLYPAIRASRVRPGEVLRGGRTRETRASGWARTALVAIQFAVATGLIACTWVIAAQTRFLATLDQGFRGDGLIQLNAAWRFAGDESEFGAASHALLAIPGVVSVGRAEFALVASPLVQDPVRLAGGTSGVKFTRQTVDTGFFAAIGMRFLNGRPPADRFGGDRILRTDRGAVASRSVNIVVNQAGVRALGLSSPADAIGRTLAVAPDDDGALLPATIVGVVGDARVRTPRDAVAPTLYVYDPAQTSVALVRYVSAEPAAVMDAVHRVWRRFEPEIPFQGRFAEEILAETWAAERARGALFAGFSALAVAIACLGLYGLSAFTIQRRAGEIGIRKVLGAKVRHIVRLLAWQFSKPVMLANIVAWPAAWWAMRDWLNGFDARIALTPGPFALASLIALAIALATIAGHTVRVARASPIHALRTE